MAEAVGGDACEGFETVWWLSEITFARQSRQELGKKDGRELELWPLVDTLGHCKVRFW